MIQQSKMSLLWRVDRKDLNSSPLTSAEKMHRLFQLAVKSSSSQPHVHHSASQSQNELLKNYSV